MRLEIRRLFAASLAAVLFTATAAVADDCCGFLYPRADPAPSYRSPYACTEPAPPSRFPPVHIPNPFACNEAYCDPSYGGNPYGQGPIPLPPPPGYGTFPPGTNPYGPPGTGPLTPREGPPRFSSSRTLAGNTQFLEEPQPKCKVSFWNHTPADLMLYVGDKTHRVPRDRAIVLSLPREFTWKTDVSADKLVQVPGDLNYYDIVIR